MNPQSRPTATAATMAALAVLFHCSVIASEGPEVLQTHSELSGFPQRPSAVEPPRWNSLRAAVQQAKLLPEPHGIIGGPYGQFGNSVSISGNRALVGFSGAALVFVDSGAGWVQEVILRPVNGLQVDRFGSAVSLDGDNALVSAPGSNNGTASGSAYLFHFDGTTWLQEAELIASDGAAGDGFGSSVSMDGTRALIGVPWDDDNGSGSGSAYVFAFDGATWVEETKLTADDGETLDVFGQSVSLDGTRALVGARWDNDRTGSAYLFAFDGTSWLQETKLTASDGAAGDWFGQSVSLKGSRALIGATGDNFRGSAYVFAFDNKDWVEETKLNAGAGAIYGFGESVSLDDTRALVGTVGDEVNGSNTGSAYLFAFDGTIWVEETKLVAGDGAEEDEFGISVSLDGDRALVGAHLDDDNGGDSGSAYLFSVSGMDWIEEAKLTAGDGPADDYFGFSVSVNGDRALVGAPADNDQGKSSGSAYLFAFDGTSWTKEAKLTASDGEADDNFGTSVSLDDNRALIGAWHDDDNGYFSGAAYLFFFDGKTWVQQAKLTAADGELDNRFGRSVSLDGNRALVGAYRDDDMGNDAGAAYIFSFNGTNWIQEAKLTADDGAEADLFGWSVSIDGDRALVGAFLDDNADGDSGSAYVFSFDGLSWSQDAKLTVSDGTWDDHFGYSVSLDGNRALLGAPGENENGTDSGAAYVFFFDGSSWAQETKLIANSGSSRDAFGYSVHLKGARAIIGALRDDDDGTNAGAAYLFTHDGNSWLEEAKLTAEDGSANKSFGSTVSLDDAHMLIGAYLDNENGGSAGAAYIFRGADLFSDSFEVGDE